jgi:hypothetical protein
MKVIYFTNNGREINYEKATLQESLEEYFNIRRKSKEGANWGHYYKYGKRIYI